MKIKLSVISLLFWITPIFCEAQCAISKEDLGDSVVSFDGPNISIYENSENGLQKSYLNWIVWKKGKDVKSLKFFLHISVYTSKPKAPVAPNIVHFTFADGRTLEYETDILSKLTKGIMMYEGLCPLEVDDYKIFALTNILSIKITDSKTGNIIISHPKSLFKFYSIIILE
ncbi:MAG TPA: hypothetical protein VIL78_07405 [Hanamia sp.]